LQCIATCQSVKKGQTTSLQCETWRDTPPPPSPTHTIGCTPLCPQQLTQSIRRSGLDEWAQSAAVLTEAHTQTVCGQILRCRQNDSIVDSIIALGVLPFRGQPRTDKHRPQHSTAYDIMGWDGWWASEWDEHTGGWPRLSKVVHHLTIMPFLSCAKTAPTARDEQQVPTPGFAQPVSALSFPPSRPTQSSHTVEAQSRHDSSRTKGR